MQQIQWVLNMPNSTGAQVPLMSLDEVCKARRFHQSFPQYAPTPLANLSRMAKRLHVSGIYVKDESFRFGLNAFKVLGGSFAIARHIAQQLGRDVSELDYNYLTSDRLKHEFGQATFFTATDGNHGRGVAWAAGKLGQKCVVKMPKGSAKSRFDNIAKEGALVSIEACNYDACVRMAASEAAQTERGVIVQDTAWDGYTQIPGWIMQGYGTMASEAAAQLQAAGVERPTHIFVQAGVGSLPGAIQGYFANLYPGNPPTVVVIEPHTADCHYQSARDGAIRTVDGFDTIMAGLACGVPNPLSWDILKNHASAFVSCPDWASANGMRMLGAPLGGDPRVISGESGAVGMGLVSALLMDDEYRPLREAIGLDAHSHILLFSTEGDTDPQNYERIVWGGAHPQG